MATIKMAVSSTIRNRIAYLKEMRSNNPIWLRTLIQRICFVPARPMRSPWPGPHTTVQNYINSRAVRKAHQQSYKEWKDNFKAKKPIVYWLTESLPKYYDNVKDAIENKWFDFADWCDNYFVQRADRWETGVKRWDFESSEELMLQVNFNQFQVFVENVLALRYIRGMIHRAYKADAGSEEEKKWTKIEKAANRYKLLHLKKYRNAEYALQYLHSQMGLPEDDYDGPGEIRRLGMILCLYIWWTQVRPNRGDSADVSGLQLFRAAMSAKYGTESDDSWSFSTLAKEEQNEYRALIQKDDALEMDWMQEDTNMLLRLVKERQNLWY